MTRVRDGQATRRVIEDAVALASAGTPTDEAIARLLAHDPATMRDAARVLRKSSTRIEARAAALLTAATGGDGGADLATDMTTEERSLVRLGPVETFRLLSARVPELAALESDIVARRGPWGQSRPQRASLSVWLVRRAGKPRTAEAAASMQASMADLRNRLKTLVGPGAQSTDPLVRATISYSWTFQHFVRLLDFGQLRDLDDGSE